MTVHLIHEVEKLKNLMLKLTALVEENVRKAVHSVNTRDVTEAESVIAKDSAIDKMEIDIEEECLKILALHQPVAIDLRYVIACLKMNNDLERIGDLACNIAERAIAVAVYEDEPIALDFYPMMEKTQDMLKEAFDALIQMDCDLAKQVTKEDDIVDEYNKQMHLDIHALIAQNPEKADFYIHLLSVSRHLERIADYATNIAEDVVYLVQGSIIRHKGAVNDTKS